MPGGYCGFQGCLFSTLPLPLPSPRAPAPGARAGTCKAHLHKCQDSISAVAHRPQQPPVRGDPRCVRHKCVLPGQLRPAALDKHLLPITCWWFAWTDELTPHRCVYSLLRCCEDACGFWWQATAVYFCTCSHTSAPCCRACYRGVAACSCWIMHPTHSISRVMDLFVDSFSTCQPPLPQACSVADTHPQRPDRHAPE
jgi:hypothetical protein